MKKYLIILISALFLVSCGNVEGTQEPVESTDNDIEAVDDEHPEAKQVTDQQSNADQLLEFKKLLDAGVITDDEFAVKKKELIGL